MSVMSPTSDSESDIEYGGPRETRCDIKCLRDATWKMWYAVISMWNVQWWCDVAGMV